MKLIKTGMLRLRQPRSLSTNPCRHGSRTNKGNQFSLAASGPGRRILSSKVLDSKNNKESQSPLVSTPSSAIRRKRNPEPKSILKTRTGNESPLTRHGHVSKSSLQMKKGRESPLIRQNHVLDTKSSLQKKKGYELPLRPSTGGLKRSFSAGTNSKMRSLNMSSYSMSPFSFSTCSRRCIDVSDHARGRTMSPFSLSPLSPHVRTYNNVSKSRNSKTKRESLSPLSMSPLSSYVKITSGHISD